ncbi:HET-domain-containing protein [Polyplosphaeria fusca]|uniref:HET-domain-containing protein n=1 Tax=Polyplosphaeria fusca TaxID=682080 RepID=A0A9P4QX22_9PLEO|nr:HET-domain-containing protein [Polyplosphaeria fusca]
MPPRTQPCYTYKALDTSTYSIRLCRILPGSSGTPIHCELEHVEANSVGDLDSNAICAEFHSDFFTLSYTWGGEKDPRWIRLNGKPFIISNNLMQALKAIRREDEPILIWIDALCIDQFNIPERNHQVSFMSDIYKRAKKTIVWLGPEAEDSQPLFDYLRTNEITHETPEEVLLALEKLSLRQYWSRAWVIQEFLSANALDIRCGGFKLLETHLQAARRCNRLSPRAEALLRMRLSHDDTNEPQARTLYDLICSFHDAECSDLCDRIFCLVSHASDCVNQRAQIVDYRISRLRLYFALVEFCRPEAIAEFARHLQLALEIPGAVVWRAFEWIQRNLDHMIAKEQDPDEENSFMETLSLSFRLNVARALLRERGCLVESIDQEGSLSTSHDTADHDSSDAFYQTCAILTKPNGDTYYFCRAAKAPLVFAFRPSICGNIFTFCLRKDDTSGVWKRFQPDPLESFTRPIDLSLLRDELSGLYDDAISPHGYQLKYKNHVPAQDWLRPVREHDMYDSEPASFLASCMQHLANRKDVTLCEVTCRRIMDNLCHHLSNLDMHHDEKSDRFVESGTRTGE